MRDLVLIYRLLDSAIRLVRVRAIGELASVARELGEIPREFQWFHLCKAKAADARSINQPSCAANDIEAACSSGVTPAAVAFGDVLGGERELWMQGVEYGRLPYAAVAHERAGLSFDPFSEFDHPFEREG